MHKLIIYLSNDAGAKLLCIAADTLSCVSNVEDLRAAAKDKEIIVIVPAEDVLLTQAKLPKLSKSRLSHALPFALEEQLIPELDTLHFVPVAGDCEDLTVAVIGKDKMQRWLAQLSEWNIKPDKLLPSCLALPYAENSWHVVLHDNAAIVRTGNYQGFACDRQNLAELLQLALSNSTCVPGEICIHNYTSQPAGADLQLAAAIREEMLPAEEFLQGFAKNADHFVDLNLLQGMFASKAGKRPQLKKLVYLSITLAAAWAVLLFVYPAVSYFLLQQRLNTINTQVAQIYRRNFPQASSMVAPKIRMEEKLHKLSGQSGENRFLKILSKLCYAIAETSNISLKRIDYQNNQFNLEIMTGSSEDMTAFSNLLTDKGLKVSQQNATLNGSRVNATIVVE